MKSCKCLFFSAVLCLFTFSLFFVSFVAASTGWSHTIQGGTYDSLIPFSVIQTGDGGYAMAVFADAKHIDNIGYLGHFTSKYELHLIKADSAGNIQWNQTFTKSDDPVSDFYYSSPGDNDYVLAQTRDGGYAIASTSGNHNFWLIKVNSNGQLVWSKTYLQTDSGYAFALMHSMSQTNDGCFVLAGSTETSEGAEDFLVVKVDSQGNEQWSQTYNSGTYTDQYGNEIPRHDEATSVIQTSDGGYALAGQTTTYVSLSSTYESFLVKTDSSGKQQWTKTYPGPNAPGAEYRVIQTKDGGFVLVTSEVKGVDDTDFQMIKTDSSGNVQWRKTYGKKYSDAACSVVQLNDDGFAIAGTMTEVGESGPISRDLGILRTDSAGNMLWTKAYNAKENATVNTKSDDYAYSMILTRDGSYFMVGSTVSAWDGSHVDVFCVKTESLEQPPESSSSLALSDISGSVSLLTRSQQGDSWVQAKDGDAISEGSKIRTEENGGKFTLAETTTLEIEPDTLIEVVSLTDSGDTLLLHEGEFSADVMSLPSGETLIVDMSQAVVEIKGTVFTVTETGTESTLSVQEGSVDFTSKVDGKIVTVESGQKIVATSTGLGSILTEPETSDTSLYLVVAAIVVVVAFGSYSLLKHRRSRIN